jgi:putative ABC transport system permease protein
VYHCPASIAIGIGSRSGSNTESDPDFWTSCRRPAFATINPMAPNASVIDQPRPAVPAVAGAPASPMQELAIATWNAFRIALGTLWAHKLRSALTIFGIVTGIAAVVLIGASLEVVREMAVKSTAQTIGANTFVVAQIASVGNLNRKELATKQRRNREIYRREAEVLAARLEADALAAPVLEEIADVKAGNRRFQAASVCGSTPTLQAIREIKLSSGRFFTEAENRRSARVAVIGRDIADEISPFTDPIGKRVRIRGQSFQVIGVQEKQGSSFGASLDRRVYMPLLAFEKIWGSRRSVSVFMQPRDPQLLENIQDQARVAMRSLRGLKPEVEDNFDLLIPEAGRSFLIRVVGIIGVAIVPISSVALIVAGIVVMNMMLVSVTERTRETGIRKSLGARNRDIFAEILFESTILTVLGGAAGLFISYVGAIALGRAFDTAVRISPTYVFMALAITTAIGIGAGFFPAYIASRMPPVEALRYET